MFRGKFFAPLMVYLGIILANSALADSDRTIETANHRHLNISYFTVDSNGVATEATEVSQEVGAARICGDDAQSITLAKLFMPHHGHGSAPTELSRTSAGCLWVANVDFIMGGLWEIRIKFEDGDTGVFHVEVP